MAYYYFVLFRLSFMFGLYNIQYNYVDERNTNLAHEAVRPYRFVANVHFLNGAQVLDTLLTTLDHIAIQGISNSSHF